MLKTNSINVSATSRVGDTDIAYFNASFVMGENGNFNFSKNIMNIPAYEANQKACNADYAEFETYAKECAEQIHVASMQMGEVIDGGEEA